MKFYSIMIIKNFTQEINNNMPGMEVREEDEDDGYIKKKQLTKITYIIEAEEVDDMEEYGEEMQIPVYTYEIVNLLTTSLVLGNLIEHFKFLYFKKRIWSQSQFCNIIF